MAGVGSFERDNSTLHVSGIGVYGDDVEVCVLCIIMLSKCKHVVRKHFGQFGETVAFKYIFSRSTALVKFEHRLNAEFAKEAMNNQSLDSAEVCIMSINSL